MDRLSKFTDSLDKYPFLQRVWFMAVVSVLVPVAFVHDAAIACHEIAIDIYDDIAGEWRELREAQRARRPDDDDDDDDDDLPNYFAPAS